MIKTLSPHYIEIPLTNPTSDIVCEKYVFKLFIWNGSKDAIPSTATYQITKINASASSGTDKVNISRIVNDFIDFNITIPSTTSLEDGNNQVWVKTSVYYNDMPTIAQVQTIQLAVKGYGYFQEGANPSTPANKILLTGDEFKVDRNGFFVLPFLLDTTPPEEPILEIDSTAFGELFFTTNIEYTEIYFRYRLEGETDWPNAEQIGYTNPFDFFVPTVPDTYELQIYTYDPLNEVVVYSPIFTLIVTP